MEKDVSITLKGRALNRFEKIKSSLNIRDDSEVLRYLIHNYYSNKYIKEQSISSQKEEQKDVTSLIKKIMQKYQDQTERIKNKLK